MLSRLYPVIFQCTSPNHPVACANTSVSCFNDEMAASLSAVCPGGHRLISTLINQFRLGESPDDGKVSCFAPLIFTECAHMNTTDDTSICSVIVTVTERNKYDCYGLDQ